MRAVEVNGFGKHKRFGQKTAGHYPSGCGSDVFYAYVALVLGHDYPRGGVEREGHSSTDPGYFSYGRQRIYYGRRRCGSCTERHSL
ncbi:hypothetical protein SDC9_132048 [bioreactor metagenome]|uniref:Uncharacterized protein n=1 Tax=bioreactor metagenome TaxID=1076179 RepID=A0A645D8P6_9ZZZZ